MEKEKIKQRLKNQLMSILIIVIGATISGTILWACYDHIHQLFPNAVNNGIIAKELGWWDSVCISWIIGTLFKATPQTK
jgi:hypothetical protein